MAEYIEREVLLQKLSRMIDYCKKDQKVTGLTALFQAGDAVMDCTTADVEPVRHGSWNIRLADEMTLCLECSECGRKVDNIDLHYLLEAGEYGEACRRYPYCHCGAKMDLEE